MAREIRLNFKIDGNVKGFANDLRETAAEADRLQQKLDDLKVVKVKIEVDDSELDAAMKKMNKGGSFKAYASGANAATAATNELIGSFTSMVSNMLGAVPMLGVVTKALGAVYSFLEANVKLLVAVQEATSEALGQVGQVSAVFSEAINPDEYERMTAIIQSASNMTGESFDKMTEYMVAATKTLQATAHEAATTSVVLTRMLGEERGKEALEWIQEYSVQFAKLGLTLEDAAAVAINSRVLGIYQDKAFDALKEVGLKINDLSTSEEKVLRDAKLFTYIEELRKSAVPARETLGKMGEAIKKMADQGKDVGPIFKALASAAGEDMGAAAVKLFEMVQLTGDLEDTYYSLAEAVNYEIKSQQTANEQFNLFSTTIGPAINNLLSSMGAAWNSIKTIFWNVATTIGKELVPVFNMIAETFRELIDQAKQGKGPLAELAGVMRVLASWVATAVRGFANWFTSLKNGKKTVGGFIDVVFDLAESIAVFIGNIVGAKDALKKFLSALRQALNPFGSVSESLNEAFGSETETTRRWVKNLRDMRAEMKKAAKEGGSLLVGSDVEVTPTDFGAGGLKSPTAAGAGGKEESAAEKEKRLLEENIFLLEKNAEEEKKINDHKLAMQVIDEENHAKKLHEIDSKLQKDNLRLYNAFYMAKLNLSEQEVLGYLEDQEKLGRYLASLSKERFEMAKDFFRKREELHLSSLDTQNKYEEKMFNLEMQRIEKIKAAEVERINKKTEDSLSYLDSETNVNQTLADSEYKKDEIALASILKKVEVVKAQRDELLKVENLSAEERVKIEQEAQQKITLLLQEYGDKSVAVTVKRADAISSFLDQIYKEAMKLSGPLGGAFNTIASGFDAFYERAKKIKEMVEMGMPKSKAAVAGLASAFTLAQTSAAGAAQAINSVIAAQTAAVDAELAAHQKKVDNLKELIEAEKQRNEEINRRQEIENALAENRIEELEQLKSTIPESEKEMADRHIELERSKIRNVDDAKKQQESQQASRLAIEEKRREALERKKQKLQQKAFEVNRAANIVEVISKGAIAVMTALAQLGPIAGAIAGAGIAVTTGVNVAMISSQKNPYAFEDGTLFVKGGKLGKDSVPAWLAGGEAVIPYKNNLDYHDAVKAIYTRSVSPEVMNGVARGDGGTKVMINIDEYGFNKSIVTANEKKLLRDKKMHLKI